MSKKQGFGAHFHQPSIGLPFFCKISDYLGAKGEEIALFSLVAYDSNAGFVRRPNND